MRVPDLDRILSAMLKTYDGISDLNFTVAGHCRWRISVS